MRTTLVYLNFTMNTPDRTSGPPRSTQTPALSRRRLDSQEIFLGSNAIEIEHAGHCYVLRVTRENKLILTK